MNSILKLYDFLKTHKTIYWLSLLLLVIVCVVCTLQLDYKEDISDFLPLTAEQKQAMDIYQQISGAERIVVIFDGGTTDDKLDAIDSFADGFQQIQTDSEGLQLTTQIDLEQYLNLLHWVYAHIPYFLTPSDYQRLDSLLCSEQYIEQGVANCKQLLQMPLSGFMQQTLQDDPLALFLPITKQLQDFQPTTGGFSSVDGYMLTEDETMAFAIVETPYGANETKQNTALTHELQHLATEVMQSFPAVNIRLLGAPVVAVENASRIKKDSILAVSLALVFILIVLLLCFRHDLRSILLILLTIGFGWLCGMAVMGAVKQEVSLIVLGIGSVIIGIAVNYPLHILFHRRYTQSVRQTLQEVLSPLVIGNITTVGAFLTLVPLKAVALRDLGIFSAAMLVGTILFSIVFLPVLMADKPKLATLQSSLRLKHLPHPALFSKPVFRYCAAAVVVLLTVVFYFFGRDIRFDSDISHLNYMTAAQRSDFAYFTSLAGETGTTEVYMVQQQDDILSPTDLPQDTDIVAVHSVYRWLPSDKEQEKRLLSWNMFWKDRKDDVICSLSRCATQNGFRPNAFSGFEQLLQTDFPIMPTDSFMPLAQNILRGYWLDTDNGRLLITRLNVTSEQTTRIEQQLQDLTSDQANIFDIRTLNASLANELSDNFDYIGLVCSLLVFIFLWISFRSLKAAIVAFMPMALSWVWILGIMNLLGLQFNIVNIILATFIFGQGDDYTIFVVEGLQYEHQTGKPMLAQYRRSIMLSALIMFLGIGVLIVARHPAMHSLGVVTLIGMGVVILLANIIPPLMRKILFFQRKK